MNKNDYITTINVNGTDVKIGMDDYGQCYYIEWEEDGETKSTGLGTYNLYYLEEIYNLFDDTYKDISRKDFLDEEMTPEELSKWNEYLDIIDKKYKEIREICMSTT